MSLRLLAAGAALAMLVPFTAQAGVPAHGAAGPAPVAWAACGPRLGD